MLILIADFSYRLKLKGVIGNKFPQNQLLLIFWRVYFRAPTIRLKSSAFAQVTRVCLARKYFFKHRQRHLFLLKGDWSKPHHTIIGTWPQSTDSNCYPLTTNRSPHSKPLTFGAGLSTTSSDTKPPATSAQPILKAKKPVTQRRCSAWCTAWPTMIHPTSDLPETIWNFYPFMTSGAILPTWSICFQPLQSKVKYPNTFTLVNGTAD